MPQLPRPSEPHIRRAVHKELNATRAIIKRLIDQRFRDIPAASIATATIRSGPDLLALRERVAELGDEVSTVIGGETVRQVRELLLSWEKRFKEMSSTDIRLVLDELFKLAAYTALRKGKSSTTGRFNPDLYSLKGVSGQSKSSAEYRRLIQTIVTTFCHRIASRLLGEPFRYPQDREELVKDGDLERMATSVAEGWSESEEDRAARKMEHQEDLSAQEEATAKAARRANRAAARATEMFETESQEVGAERARLAAADALTKARKSSATASAGRRPKVGPSLAAAPAPAPAARSSASRSADQRPTKKLKAKLPAPKASEGKERFAAYGGRDKAFWTVVGYSADEHRDLDVDGIYEALQDADAFDVAFSNLESWREEEGITADKLYRDYGKPALKAYKTLKAQDRADEDYVEGKHLVDVDVNRGFEEID